MRLSASFGFVLLASLTTACAEEPQTGQDESFAKSVMGTSRSRDLSPGVPVFDEGTIGADIEAKVAELADGAAYHEDEYEWGEGTCTTANYRSDAWHYINHEHCPGESNIVRAYVEGERMPVAVWADHDDDGRIDAWTRDDVDGTGYGRDLHDDNHDGRVDRETIDVELLGDDLDLSLYAGCEIPAHPARRILEDLDGDGLFDVESVTAGKGPDGDWSYWLCDTPSF